MPKFDVKKSLQPASSKMFTTAIEAAMAAVQDARGNINAKLAQTHKPALKVPCEYLASLLLLTLQRSTKHPRFENRPSEPLLVQVVKAGQSLAEAEPEPPQAEAEPEPPQAEAEPEPQPEAQAEVQTGEAPEQEEEVAAPDALEGGVPQASETGPTGDLPPASPQMFPPGVMKEVIDPRSGGPAAAYYPTSNGMVENAMSPGVLPAGQPAQINEVPYPAQPQAPVYPGAQVRVTVKKSTPAVAAVAPVATTGDMCTEGDAQSPINIEVNVEAAELPVLAWRLASPDATVGSFAAVEEDGQGKWLRAVDAGLAMSVKGDDYQLRSLIVHSPSEHTVAGQRYDMELQFLHSAAFGDQSKFLMVSALVNKADAAAASPALADLASKVSELDSGESGRFGFRVSGTSGEHRPRQCTPPMKCPRTAWQMLPNAYCT